VPIRSIAPELLVAVCAGALLRFAPIVGTGFPVGDGGLFAQMALDLRAHAFIPPPTVTYYGAPWVYPPLGLYVLALIPGDPAVTLQWLPATWSIGLIGAVWLLAKELLGRRAAGAAAMVYALVPWSYLWLIQGGGVTRAPGALFAVLAVWAAVKQRWLLLGVFMGMTVITHPEAALFGIMSVWIVWGARWRSWRAFLAIPVALAITSTWLAILLPRLGVDGLLNAVMSRAGGLGFDSLRKVIVLGELWPVALLGLIGVWLCLRGGRERWLVVWAVACMLLPGAIGRWVAVPWAIWWAVALEPVLRTPGMRRWALVPVAATLCALVALGATEPQLSEADRVRMAQIAQTVPPGVSYAVSGSPEMMEWFPYLAKHHSTTSGYGYEWVGGIPAIAADRVYATVGP